MSERPAAALMLSRRPSRSPAVLTLPFPSQRASHASQRNAEIRTGYARCGVQALIASTTPSAARPARQRSGSDAGTQGWVPGIKFVPMPGWDDVVTIGSELPEVEVGSWWGTPGLKVAGKGFCRTRTKPDALVIRVLDIEDRAALIAGDPDVFFITPHYAGAPYVLVALERVTIPQLRELIEDGWRLTAPPKLQAQHPEIDAD
jgi:hypothetical protein